jgi:hypothetical protein
MSDQTEILEPGGSRQSTARKGSVVAVSVALVVALVLGGSAFAVYKLFFSGGAQPAEALPASTLALVSVDLNPSAGQKVEALKTMRKFPKLKDELGLDADDDLRRLFFEEVIKEGDCADLDYDADVEPWVGKRAAFGAVDLGGDQPSPVAVLQVTDKDAAGKGFAKLVECGDGMGDDFGFTVTDDYLVASDSVDNARKIVAQAEEEPLSEDADYQKWTEAAGDAGVLSFYVGQDAADALMDAFDQGDEQSKMARAALEKFQGLAGTVRFADGGMEMAVVGGGVEQYSAGPAVGKQLGSMPADTAALLGFGVPDDFVEQVLAQLRDQLGAETSREIDEQIEAFEAETGLEFPEDVQALLGDSVAVALGGDAPASLNDINAPADVPVGLVISGDAERIEEVIDKIERASGASLDAFDVVRKSEGDRVAIASSEGYADALLGGGDLSDDERFQRAVPQADRSTGVVYLDFDSDWVTSIVDTFGADTGEDTAELRKNLEPLEAFGFSNWQDGDVSHFLLKVTTD